MSIIAFTNVLLDMDKLVSIKGLVIRATPIIPDMKEGELERDHLRCMVMTTNDSALYSLLSMPDL